MKLRLRPGPGARRFLKSRAQLRRELAQQDQQIVDKDALIRTLHRAVGRTDGVNEYLTSQLTVARSRLDNAQKITVPAPRDRRVPSGERTVETNVLALRDHDDTAVRPYAPKPAPPQPSWAVQSPSERIAWGAGSDNPAHIPGTEADTTRLPKIAEEANAS